MYDTSQTKTTDYSKLVMETSAYQMCIRDRPKGTIHTICAIHIIILKYVLSAQVLILGNLLFLIIVMLEF